MNSKEYAEQLAQLVDGQPVESFIAARARSHAATLREIAERIARHRPSLLSRLRAWYRYWWVSP